MNYTQNSTDSEVSRHKENILPVCSICNQVPSLGIKGVIKVGRAWICWECEQDIMLLEIGSPGYGVMIEKIRSIWK